MTSRIELDLDLNNISMFCVNCYALQRGGTGAVNDIRVLGLFPLENVWKLGENS